MTSKYETSTTTQLVGNSAISVHQAKRGCLQEVMGREAHSEYKVYAGHLEDGKQRDESSQQSAHIIEESSCQMRFCCPSCRPVAMNMTVGNSASGEKLMTFQKEWTMPMCGILYVQGDHIPIPCCCFLPKMKILDADGRSVGRSEVFVNEKVCVPKLRVLDAEEKVQYWIEPNVCCGGHCPACQCCHLDRSEHCVYIPFYIRDPESKATLPSSVEGKEAQIKKVWSGMSKECCSDADNFQVLFPQAANSMQRANLLGATMLLDFAFYEHME
mmetsp:Transcript_29077/g.45575  ORF Transcript_29077/g.45575 Transcript_29077/m.45575 type:complete len:271 (-) Transcript_29077:243-1055(-)